MTAPNNHHLRLMKLEIMISYALIMPRKIADHMTISIRQFRKLVQALYRRVHSPYLETRRCVHHIGNDRRVADIGIETQVYLNERQVGIGFLDFGRGFADTEIRHSCPRQKVARGFCNLGDTVERPIVPREYYFVTPYPCCQISTNSVRRCNKSDIPFGRKREAKFSAF